jgi:septal ring factor EnvC (AmiA/AmiB activator)
MEESTIDAIHRLLSEITETKAESKTVKEHLKDIMEQNDDYRQLEEELKELTAKRAKAKEILQSDSDYQKFNSELEELKFKLKDLGEILSHHLVSYYNETNATQIKDEQGEVRQVIISAKIGKAEAETP